MGSKRTCIYAVIVTLIFGLNVSVAEEANIYYPLVYEKKTSDFGKRLHPIRKKYSFHEGVDLYAKVGAEVNVISKGRVVFAGEFGNYGKTVVVEHANKITSHYCHLRSLKVDIGDELLAGQAIGEVGRSGKTTGAHLHFEIRQNGEAINPAILFPAFKNKSDVS